MEPDVRTDRQESGRARCASAAGPNRNGNAQGRSGSAMDDEFLPGRNRHSLSQAAQARPRYRRGTGDLSRLPGIQGLHVSVRTHLDQRDGASPEIDGTTYVDRPIVRRYLTFDEN